MKLLQLALNHFVILLHSEHGYFLHEVALLSEYNTSRAVAVSKGILSTPIAPCRQGKAVLR